MSHDHMNTPEEKLDDFVVLTPPFPGCKLYRCKNGENAGKFFWKAIDANKKTIFFEWFDEENSYGVETRNYKRIKEKLYELEDRLNLIFNKITN